VKRFRAFTIVQLLIVPILVFLCSGCVGAPAKNSSAPAESPSESAAPLSWRLIGFKGESAAYNEKGGAIPPWVAAWLEGGGAAVETLEEYQDYYVFIAVNSGVNFNALEQWQEGFSPELDFARLAAARIENRFLGAVQTHPDNDYGSFFETIIRAASDTEWKGMVREADFWIKREFPDADGVETDRESWDFLILITVEKDTFAAQFNTLMGNTKPEFPINRDQTAAVNQVWEKFFNGF
jgi:hypothetical protein